MTLTRPTSLTDPRLLRSGVVAGSLLMAVGLAGNALVSVTGALLVGLATATASVMTRRDDSWFRWKMRLRLDERELQLLAGAIDSTQTWMHSVGGLACGALGVSAIFGADSLPKTIVINTVLFGMFALEWMPVLTALSREAKALAED